MKNVALKKVFDVLTRRPSRLLKKDFYLRLKRIVESALIFRALQSSIRPRLYYDVTTLSLFDNQTGVQRVVRSVFQELKPLLGQRYEIIPVSCTAVTFGFQALEEVHCNNKLKFKLTNFNISPEEGDVFLSLDQAFIEHLAQKEAFLAMKEKGCRVILAVYDLLPLQLPHCFPKEVENIFEQWLLTTSCFAEFLCDSKTVQEELLNYLSLKNKFAINSYWFYPGSDFVKKVSSEGISPEQIKYLENLKNFSFNFLMVGTIEPRKGHRIILDLFSELWADKRKDISLTFVGKEGWMVKELIASFKNIELLNENFFWFNNASDAFLDKCYKKTDAVIVASLNEGFGLPVIEATQRGCRVIANDIPIFREVAPKNCFFINLTSPELAKKQLQDWLGNPPPACSNMKSHSWKESTVQIIEKLSIR